MKHFLLFISFSIAFMGSGFSQNLSIRDKNGKDLTNQTTTVYIDQRRPVELAEFFIVNPLSTDILVSVRKMEDKILAGAQNSFALVDKNIKADFSETENSLLIPAFLISNRGDFLIEYYSEGKSGTSIITYQFYSPDNLFEPVTLTVNFVSGLFSSSGVESIPPRISDPRPNPARDFAVFDYSLPSGTRSARLVVRNLTGTVVLDVPLSATGSRVRIETNSLNNGVYLYSFVVNEQIMLTRKLVISR